MLLRFLVASGPTEEPIDPVRFISNRSTGVMGRHLALAVRQKGHRLTWIECPKNARTALELHRILKRELPKNDVLIMAAAVADFRPAGASATKRKKEKIRAIRLIRNPDILKSLKSRKKRGQVFIGFGVESSGLKAKGLRKLREKGLELIVMQKAGPKASPFGERPVDVSVLDRQGRCRTMRGVSKRQLAGRLVREAERLARLKSF